MSFRPSLMRSWAGGPEKLHDIWYMTERALEVSKSMILYKQSVKCFPLRSALLVTFLWAVNLYVTPTLGATDSSSTSMPLKAGWTVQSDCKIHGDGAKLSTPGTH